MAGGSSIDAVKRKIKVLQQQADEAEERAEILQRQVEEDKRAREQVNPPSASAFLFLLWNVHLEEQEGVCFIIYSMEQLDFSSHTLQRHARGRILPGEREGKERKEIMFLFIYK